MSAYSSTKQKVATFYHEEIIKQVEQTVSHFRYLTGKHALFHIVFFMLFISELLCLLLFLPFLAKSFLFAALVAATCLTAFSYFVLRFYLQTKKPEQFLLLRDTFIQNCQQMISPTADLSESRRGFLQAIYQLIHRLDGQEYHYYKLLGSLQTLAPLVQKFSVWCHWGDLHLMKELLHTYCLRTLLEWVKAYPTDLELHTALVSGYISLYKIYQHPAKSEQPIYPFIAKEYASPEMQQKFLKTAQCALEELKIILHYIPHDIWGLTQLGIVYHDLDLREEERKTYETLLQLAPHEKEVRFRLGILYFQLGFMANGLKIYEDLRKINDPKAAELIQHYDVFHSQIG